MPHASCSFVVCLACSTALFKSVQLPASAEMLHLRCSLKYACGHISYRPLVRSSWEKLRILQLSLCFSSRPKFPNTDLNQFLLSAIH